MLTIRHVTLVLVLFWALPVSANWNGYLNTQSVADVEYGYLATSSSDEASGKLRLVCLSDNTFTLLFDKNITGQRAGIPLKVRIDSLPAMTFRLSRLGEEYGVGDQEPGFWKLIAQMAAGGSIKIGQHHQYSLAGFTKAYSQTCGSFELAYQYQKFLHLYR